MSEFVRDGKGAILLSSHIMSDVDRIASHLVFIKNGEILLNEEKNKVFKSYAIVDIDEKQLTLINKDIVVAKRNYGSYFSVLVSDKEELPNKIMPKPISMEEISVLLARSEK